MREKIGLFVRSISYISCHWLISLFKTNICLPPPPHHPPSKLPSCRNWNQRRVGGQTQWAVGAFSLEQRHAPWPRPLHPAPQPGCVGVSDHWWWIARRPNRSNSLRPRHFDYKSRERERACTAIVFYSLFYSIDYSSCNFTPICWSWT